MLWTSQIRLPHDEERWHGGELHNRHCRRSSGFGEQAEVLLQVIYKSLESRGRIVSITGKSHLSLSDCCVMTPPRTTPARHCVWLVRGRVFTGLLPEQIPIIGSLS